MGGNGGQTLRTAIHTMNLSPTKVSLHCILRVFFRTESETGQTTNRSSEKSNEDHRTEIIATNFICEQSKTNSWEIQALPKSFYDSIITDMN